MFERHVRKYVSSTYFSIFYFVWFPNSTLKLIYTLFASINTSFTPQIPLKCLKTAIFFHIFLHFSLFLVLNASINHKIIFGPFKQSQKGIEIISKWIKNKYEGVNRGRPCRKMGSFEPLQRAEQSVLAIFGITLPILHEISYFLCLNMSENGEEFI